MGRCPACGSWNSFELHDGRAAAISRAKAGRSGHRPERGAVRPVPLADIEGFDDERIPVGIEEFDRVLGGGLVPGSVILLGGAPGVGKSTLLLQVCLKVASRRVSSGSVLYVSGEESARQVRMRAGRIAQVPAGLFILTETDVSAIEAVVHEVRPALLVVDSVQTLCLPDLDGAPGTLTQVRETAGRLAQLAKACGIPVILVGHINKEGMIAGPKTLEHIVDVVLLLEGDRYQVYRTLRGVKNRYGSTSELGLFVMGENGLEEVRDPSGVLLAERPQGVAGSVVAAGLEGTRPLLVEVQALVTSSGCGTPRRAVTGLDSSRVALLLAVLEKRAGLAIGSCDVYVKLSGGLWIDEPGIDLAAALALASAFRGRPVGAQVAAAGEVGLGGEVRAVPRMAERVAEAARLGFTKFIHPGSGRPGHETHGQMEIITVRTVSEALEAAMG